MRNRSLAVVGFLSFVAVVVACGSSSDSSSEFDAAPPPSTGDSGLVGDATVNPPGDDDSGGFVLPDAGPFDAAPVIDCDADPIACIKAVCGDGVLEPGETCDDGNTAGGDGCSATCQTEGPYYLCVPGEKCIDERDCTQLQEAGVADASMSDGGCTAPPKPAICGDAVLDPGEACDTGSDVGQPQSGCSQDCKSVFAGYVCTTAGKDCTNTWICGDGKVEGSESCDDGNAASGDGCSSSCTIEQGYKCTLAGIACTAAKCGDGILAKPETCDDGNTNDNDGCSATCTLQAKVTVTNPTATTQGGTTITNYTCPTPGKACVVETCGNGSPITAANPRGKPAGTEQCDDGNTKNYDGCSNSCQLEPSCPNGVCVAVCGDGLVFDFDGNGDGKPDEACDDGNTTDGDGCSSMCQVEDGYSCTTTTLADPAFVDVPVVYRDFLYKGTTTTQTATYVKYAHPDFENYVGTLSTPFLNKAVLTGGVPVFEWDGLHDPNASNAATAADTTPGVNVTNPNTPKQGQQQLTGAKDFSDWYADVIDPDGAGLTLPRGVRIDNQTIRMTLQSGSYIFDSQCDQPFGQGYNTSGQCLCSDGTVRPTNGCTTYGGLGGFLPIDGKGWDGAPYNVAQTSQNQYNDGGAHNFSFTTQFRYYFTYDATQEPTLAFSGDDDVWVFLANQRALDIGGLHSRLTGQFVLSNGSGKVTIPTGGDANLAKTLGLVNGHVYEVDLFNAERHTTGSNFKLTLSGFTKKISVCGPKCGDGIRTPTEQCDNGTSNATPAPYNGCTTSCTLGPYCGDDKTQMPPEQCDDGVNETPYSPSPTSTACAPGCTKPAYCGDGTLQSSNEQCDNGAMNSDTNDYNGCTTSCTAGPRCGDAVVQSQFGEACDNGFNATPYVRHPAAGDCAPGCKEPEFCGDGHIDVPYEVCDNGASNSDTAYDGCTTSCALGPHCGDGIVQPPETCDDGNMTSGDGCSSTCQKEGIR